MIHLPDTRPSIDDMKALLIDIGGTALRDRVIGEREWRSKQKAWREVETDEIFWELTKEIAESINAGRALPAYDRRNDRAKKLAEKNVLREERDKEHERLWRALQERVRDKTADSADEYDWLRQNAKLKLAQLRADSIPSMNALNLWQYIQSKGGDEYFKGEIKRMMARAETPVEFGDDGGKLAGALESALKRLNALRVRETKRNKRPTATPARAS